MKKPRQSKLNFAEVERQKATDAALKAMMPRIEIALAGVKSIKQWRLEQRRYVFDMAAGMSADEIVDLWQELCDERGYTVYSMKWLQGHALRAKTKRNPDHEIPEVFGNPNDPPTASELRAMLREQRSAEQPQ